VSVLPASHRARVRLLWASVAAAALLGVALLVVLAPNTGRSLQTPVDDRPPTVLREPKHVRPTSQALRSARRTLDAFVRSAVIRRNLAASWPLATAHMRVGVSRQDWLSGNLPVAPYPAEQFGSASFRLVYSYRNVLGFDVTVHPSEPDFAAGSYRCELHRQLERWLVDFCYGEATPRGRVSPVINPSLGG
jgi:hypothetical protein